MSAQSRRISLLRCLISLMVLLVLSAGLCVFSVSADNEQTAKDICSKCKLSTSGNKDRLYRLYDNSLDTSAVLNREGEQYIKCDLAGKKAVGIYIQWGTVPEKWLLKVSLDNGETTTIECGAYGFLQDYIELPEGTEAFSIVTTDGKKHPMVILEMEVYTAGLLPDSVHIWDPTPSTAEIMIIPTHQDDELLYFGGAIPYYGGELELDTVVVYMAYRNDLRLHEALEGLWTCGLRQHPVFVRLPDVRSMSLDGARKTWDEADVVKKLTALLAKYRPQVVVSHDINGEYGHGQHIMTVHCLRQALEKAADSDYMSKNLTDMQCWTVQKCYLHLYEKNQISMPWDKIKLQSMGDRTSLEIARIAFRHHESQQIFGYEVSLEADEYDCRQFGLYWSQVGADANKDDFFENITLRYKHIGMPAQIPDDFQKAGSTGVLYKHNNDDGTVDYLRYCSINGAAGWYVADDTGCPLSPPVPYVPFEDLEVNLTYYETLTQIADSPAVYIYDSGDGSEEAYLRYGTVIGGTTGYYSCDSDGELDFPAVMVEINRQTVDPLKNTQEGMSDGASSFFNRLFPGCSQFEIVLMISVMSVVVLAAISLVAVIMMAAKNQKNKKRRTTR